MDRTNTPIPHNRIAEVALDSLTMSRQQLLNQWAGETLKEMMGDAELELSPARIAYHFAKAGDASKALNYARQAADNAINLSVATESMIHSYQLSGLAKNSSELVVETYRRLGGLHLAHGPVGQAVENYRLAVRKSGEQSTNETADLVSLLSFAHAAAGQFEESAEVAETGLKTLVADISEEHVAWLQALKASAQVFSEPDVDKLTRELQTAEESCLRVYSTILGKRGAVRCRTTLANFYVGSGNPSEAILHFKKSADYGAKAQDFANQALSLSSAAYFALLQSRLEEAEELLAEAQAITGGPRAARRPLHRTQQQGGTGATKDSSS